MDASEKMYTIGVSDICNEYLKYCLERQTFSSSDSESTQLCYESLNESGSGSSQINEDVPGRISFMSNFTLIITSTSKPMGW